MVFVAGAEFFVQTADDVLAVQQPVDQVEVVAEAGSTNALVSERAQRGAPEGLVILAEHQTAGRGRLDRSWETPPGSGLTFSVLLRPDLPRARWGWLPLWGGLAVADALRERCGLDAVLKWPNDVLVGESKVCGLLAEASGRPPGEVGFYRARPPLKPITIGELATLGAENAGMQAADT